MKRTSIVGAVLVSAIALSVPVIAWSHVNLNVSSNQDITDTVMSNHHGGTDGGTHHGGHGRHGGCW
jgi:hypothetical protein